jgi:hypothetical protein
LRCSGKTATGSAVRKGIATSWPSSRIILQQHSRFASINQNGVTTSAQRSRKFRSGVLD